MLTPLDIYLICKSVFLLGMIKVAGQMVKVLADVLWHMVQQMDDMM